MDPTSDPNDTQIFLLQELAKANLANLVLAKDGEDVYESADGQTVSEKASKQPRLSFPHQFKNEVILEISDEGARAIAIEQRRRAKQFSKDGTNARKVGLIVQHEVESEESLGQKIEKIMNRIVVRRQRAYLTGVLRDPTKARTAKLIETYQKNAGLI